MVIFLGDGLWLFHPHYLLVGGLEHFFTFPYIGNSNPNWLIFFRGVETTNQSVICRHRDGSLHLEQTWNRPFILGYQTEDPAVRPNPRNDIWCGNKAWAISKWKRLGCWVKKFRSQAMEGSLGNIFEEQVCCLTKSVVRIKRKIRMASMSIRVHQFHIFRIHQFHAICIHWIGLRWFQGKSARTPAPKILGKRMQKTHVFL